jgi:hypothetical protein
VLPHLFGPPCRCCCWWWCLCRHLLLLLLLWYPWGNCELGNQEGKDPPIHHLPCRCWW